MNTHTRSKSQRINLRASERQEALLRSAAEATHASLTDFILGSAVDRAERILADRRWFSARPEQYDEFIQLLDRPVDTAKLATLASRKPIFNEPFELTD